MGRLIWVVVGMTLMAGTASAQVLPQPEHSIAYRSITAARVNPLGLVNFSRMSYRYRLFESDSDIARQNFVGIGLAGGISPAWGRIGVLAEVQPLSILRLYGQYELIGNFGTFNLFASFPSASADFSDSAIRARADIPGSENYTTHGGILTLGATPQVKVGPIAVRSLFRAIYTNYDTRRGDSLYYDQILDMLMPNDGWVMVNDLDAFYVHDFEDSNRLAVGARWTYSQAFYNDSHRLPGETALPNNEIHRLGLIVAYTFSTASEPSLFDKPTLIVLAQWHLQHRWRTGQDVSQAIPYAGVAFSFEGDLLGN